MLSVRRGEDRLHVLRRIDLEDRLQIFISVERVDKSAQEQLVLVGQICPVRVVEGFDDGGKGIQILVARTRDALDRSRLQFSLFLDQRNVPSDVWLMRNESMFTMSWMNVGNSEPWTGSKRAM